MLGEPKFKREQRVSFTCENAGETKQYNGVVYIVDPNGTIEQNKEPSYDIEAFIDGEVILFKHIPESSVTER